MLNRYVLKWSETEYIYDIELEKEELLQLINTVEKFYKHRNYIEAYADMEITSRKEILEELMNLFQVRYHEANDIILEIGA